MTKEKGSDRLFKERIGGSAALSPEAVKRLIALVDRDGIHVKDWTIFGTPDPDTVVGTIHVPVKDAGGVIQDLIDLPGGRVRITDSFSLGIVVPQEFQLTFSARGVKG